MDEDEELRADLQFLEKDRVIDLFIKLKKAYTNVCERLEKAEQELLDKTSLDELINSIDGE